MGADCCPRPASPRFHGGRLENITRNETSKQLYAQLQAFPHYQLRMQTEEDCRNNDEQARLPDNPAERRLNPSIGSNVKVLVLLVKFKGETNTDIPPLSHFEELFNGNGKSPINEAGSIRQYLRYASLGKYNVQFVVRDWVDVPQTEEYYAKGVSGRIGNIPQQELFADAMADIDVDFDLFDWFDYDTISNQGESGDGTLYVFSW
jgi:hypothetical protein